MTVGCPELNEAMNPLADTLETVRLTLAATVGAALDEGALEASSDTDLLGAMHTVSDYERAARAVHEHIAPSTGERLPSDYPCLRAAMVDGTIGSDGLVAAIAPLAHVAADAGRAAHLAADEELAA